MPAGSGGRCWSWASRRRGKCAPGGSTRMPRRLPVRLVEDLGLKLDGARVLLLGAGGAGRTAALKLAQEGVGVLHLVNRTASRAAELADEIGRRFPGVKVELGYPAAAVDLVLNATSLGLRPEDGSPLDSARLGWARIGAVYDMIYRPAETRLLREARGAGCRSSNGLGMLLYQGARALELWTGRAAPVDGDAAGA
jgi:shikimate dehydrogenase